MFIALEESKSLIFKKPINESVTCIEHTNLNGRLLFGKDDFRKTHRKVSDAIMKGGSAFDVATKFTMGGVESTCHSKLQETVHMWSNEHFGFIWSCRSLGGYRESHEQGLIIHVAQKRKINEEDLYKILPFYFEDRLIDEIKIQINVTIPECDDTDLYPCVGREYINLEIMILLWVLLIGGLVIVIRCNLK